LKVSKSIVISYFDKENSKSCLDGLSEEEKMIFQKIVQKQLQKNIKIKIEYSEIDLPIIF
jgi:hypothetical protein